MIPSTRVSPLIYALDGQANTVCHQNHHVWCPHPENHYVGLCSLFFENSHESITRENMFQTLSHDLIRAQIATDINYQS